MTLNKYRAKSILGLPILMHRLIGAFATLKVHFHTGRVKYFHHMDRLLITTLWANSADDKLFVLFSRPPPKKKKKKSLKFHASCLNCRELAYDVKTCFSLKTVLETVKKSICRLPIFFLHRSG